MSGSVFELLDLIARWVHVIAGIMWIGNSMLFNWLDRSLVTNPNADRTNAPVGTIWLLHSGGFYYVEKTLLRGQALPHPLHWFKWQAYTTWISGVALLFVVYYASDRAVLADPSVAQLDRPIAVGIGLGSIGLGWALYESMQRFVAPRAPALAATVWIGGLIAIAIGLTQLLSGRASFLHVGAMLGIWFLAAAFGNKFAGVLASTFGEGEATHLDHFFGQQAAAVAVIGVLFLIMVPWVKRRMGGVR